MRRRSLSMMLLVVLMVTSLVGCSDKKSDMSDEDANANLGPVTLTIAHNQSESSHPVLQAYGDKFKELTGNTVEFIYVPAGEFKNWITTQLAAGTAPDIIMGGDITKAEMGTFYKNGWFADVTSYIDQTSPYAKEIWRDTFLPGMIDAGTANEIGNKVIGLPVVSVSKDLYYNTAIFEEIGIAKAPETLSELLEVCEKIQKHGKYIPISGMLQPTLQWNTWFIERAVMVDFWNDVIPTLDIINKNGVLDMEEQALGVKAGVMMPDDQRMVDYFSYMKKLAPYFQNGFTAADWSFESLFNEGKSAMTTNGMWYLVQHEQLGLSVPYGVARIPYVDKAVSQSSPGVLRMFASQGEVGLYYVTQKAVENQHIDAAIDYVRFLTDPNEGAKMVSDGQGFLPTVKNVEVDSSKKIVMDTKGDEANPMPELYLHNFMPEANQKFCVMFADFLTNDTSAEEFVQKQYKPLVLESCDEVIMAHPEWEIEKYVEMLSK